MRGVGPVYLCGGSISASEAATREDNALLSGPL